jgi:transcription elongation GreA/GreB family factor/very-short-patch-repair endonuclease
MQDGQITVHDKSKVVRLIDYLTKLASLRSKIIRNVNDYSRVIWINDIPKQLGCFTQAWGRSEDIDTDIWVEIQNKPEPKQPNLPEQLKGFIDIDFLRKKVWMPQNLNGTVHPEIFKALQFYKTNQWEPWVIQHNIWEERYKIYTSFFAIYQEQLRLGEEYELVLGLGLLTWQTPTSQYIRRHLIVANASLEFEAHLGKFTIRPNPEGANVRPELDMLDIDDQPRMSEENSKSMLNDAADDPWEKVYIEKALKVLVHSFNPPGEYEDSMESQNSISSDKPIVELAPAIILRKRTIKGLTETLKRIKERIEKGEVIPVEFKDLAEIPQRNDLDTLSDPGNSEAKFDGEIYFPKPSNEEQRQIVHKIHNSTGVLVQGPPGTGKSHTIANLICHLLAKGQRILITAKTPRALQVLEGLLPNEIRPLCINLLGSGLEEKRSLETSVGGILRNNEKWKNHDSELKIQNQELRVLQLRKMKAEIEKRIRLISESETYCHTIVDGHYKGTASQIAQKINMQAPILNWFTDVIPADNPCPIKEEELSNVHSFLCNISTEKLHELELELPEHLLEPNDFSDLISSEEIAANEEEAAKHDGDINTANNLTNLQDSLIINLKDSLTAYLNKWNKLSALPYDWIQKAKEEIVLGRSSVWRKLHHVTIKTVKNYKDVRLADNTTIEIPEDINKILLLEDLGRLKDHLKQGGNLGWWLFRPKPVKECMYILKTICVNGRKCNNLSQFQLLSDVLSIHIEFNKTWDFWKNICETNTGPFSLQLLSFSDLCGFLNEAILLEELANKCRQNLEKSGDIVEPRWNSEHQVKLILGSCKLALAQIARRQVTDQIKQVESQLRSIDSGDHSHPIIVELLSSVCSRDLKLFTKCFNKIEILYKEKKDYQIFKENITRLSRFIPNMINDLRLTCNEIYWDTRISKVGDAWRWMQAKTWSIENVRKENLSDLARRVEQLECDINECIAEIASLRAWTFCFSRLQQEQRRHMEAWQQSMQLLGKGTGKHAPRHRRDAQKHLNECREAIPAWVMPLHRVWDTIDPAPGMFDVVIIDEASQCGFEALPLLYLGKKMLIVGDDKQISPDAVGIQRDTVFRLMEEFLFDYNFRSSFNIESSLFSHCKLRYGIRRVTLREHFRSMPEIIRFSNDLCYQETPLLPLRQYGPDRLNPLEHVYIKDGYRQGSNNLIINEDEAEAIANKIMELCHDVRYIGKSMGVVVLQGDAQAGLIEEKLLNLIGAEEIKERRIVCGNPYSFQGDERDIIFLSMVAAPNERIGALTKPSDERRFNVAASRAKDQMWLFHSVTCNDLSTFCLRRRLLEFFQNTKTIEIAGIQIGELEKRAFQDNREILKPPKPFDSWFEVDVALMLGRKNYKIIPQFDVAGKSIDIVIEGGKARLAVECDGDEFHGIDRFEEDMERQRMLERCGWTFFRVRASHFYVSAEDSLKDLWRMLDERDIFPQTFLQKDPCKTVDIQKKMVGEFESCQGNEISTFQTLTPKIIVELGDIVEYFELDNPEIQRQAQITNRESNPELGLININTPIAHALLKSAVGEIIEIHLPIGIKHFQITKIIKSKF